MERARFSRAPRVETVRNVRLRVRASMSPIGEPEIYAIAIVVGLVAGWFAHLAS